MEDKDRLVFVEALRIVYAALPTITDSDWVHHGGLMRRAIGACPHCGATLDVGGSGERVCWRCGYIGEESARGPKA